MNGEKINTFKDLEVWRRCHAVVIKIYAFSRDFPKDELYGLTNQLRRAALSITSNIAEGFGRRGAKEKLQFYSIAMGSLREVENQLIVAKDLVYLTPDQFNKLDFEIQQLYKMLNAFISKTRSWQLRKTTF